MRYRSFNFRFAEEILNSRKVVKDEIDGILNEITIHPNQLDPKPHEALTQAFKTKGWEMEQIAGSNTDMRFDLYKSRVAIEVETSHIVHTYKDYLKFLVGFNDGKIDVGVEVVYTKDYVKRTAPTKTSSPTLEKVKKDLGLFRATIPVPIYVIGLED